MKINTNSARPKSPAKETAVEYTVTAAGFIAGRRVAKDETVFLTPSQAKYLSNVTPGAKATKATKDVK